MTYEALLLYTFSYNNVFFLNIRDPLLFFKYAFYTVLVFFLLMLFTFFGYGYLCCSRKEYSFIHERIPLFHLLARYHCSLKICYCLFSYKKNIVAVQILPSLMVNICLVTMLIKTIKRREQKNKLHSSEKGSSCVNP